MANKNLFLQSPDAGDIEKIFSEGAAKLAAQGLPSIGAQPQMPSAPKAPTVQRAPRTGDVESFVQQYQPLAERVGQKLGVSPEALLGQWGLETGWGRSVIPGTNNLGNIKDFSGKGVQATDNMTGSRDAYRAYANPDEFADDFAGLLSRRYQNALGTGADATRYFSALKEKGYAEDPHYVAKGTRAAQMAARAMQRKTEGDGATDRYQPLSAEELQALGAAEQSRFEPLSPDEVKALEAQAKPAEDEGGIGTLLSDIGRMGLGALNKGVGQVVGGIGEGARIVGEYTTTPLINAVFGTNFRTGNALQPIADFYREAGLNTQAGVSELSKQAIKNSTPDGDLFKPSTWSMGEDWSPRGALMLTVDVLGSMAPVIAASVATGGSAAVGAGVGAAQSGGAAADQAREAIREMAQKGTLEKESAYYRELLAQGKSPREAQIITEDAAANLAVPMAAIVGGLGGAATSKIVNPATNIMSGAPLAGRIAGRAGIGAVEEGAQEVAEGVVTRAGTNMGAGTDLDLTEGSFGDAVLGAMGGGTVGGAAGALSKRQEQAPAQESAPRREPVVDVTYADEQGNTVTEVVPAEQEPSGPIGRALKKSGPAQPAAAPEADIEALPRVRVVAENGSTITGFAEQLNEDGTGRVLGDDGQVHIVRAGDGATILPEAAENEAASAQQQPVSESIAPEVVEQPALEATEIEAAAPVETAAEADAQPTQNAMPEGMEQAPVATETVAQKEPEPSERPLSEWTEQELRERLKYVTQQAKVAGWDGRLVKERARVSREINRRNSEARNDGNTAANAVPNAPVAQTSDQAAAPVQSDQSARSAPAEVSDVRADGGQDATRATELPVGEAVSGADTATQPDAALKDAHAGKWFGSSEKAEAYIAKKKISDTHEVVKTGKVRFEVKPKAVQESGKADMAAIIENVRKQDAETAAKIARDNEVARKREGNVVIKDGKVYTLSYIPKAENGRRPIPVERIHAEFPDSGMILVLDPSGVDLNAPYAQTLISQAKERGFQVEGESAPVSDPVAESQRAIISQNTRSRLTRAYNGEEYRGKKEDYATLRADLEQVAADTSNPNSAQAKEVLDAVDQAIQNLEAKKRYEAEREQAPASQATEQAAPATAAAPEQDTGRRYHVEVVNEKSGKVERLSHGEPMTQEQAIRFRDKFTQHPSTRYRLVEAEQAAPAAQQPAAADADLDAMFDEAVAAKKQADAQAAPKTITEKLKDSIKQQGEAAAAKPAAKKPSASEVMKKIDAHNDAWRELYARHGGWIKERGVVRADAPKEVKAAVKAHKSKSAQLQAEYDAAIAEGNLAREVKVKQADPVQDAATQTGQELTQKKEKRAPYISKEDAQHLFGPKKPGKAAAKKAKPAKAKTQTEQAAQDSQPGSDIVSSAKKYAEQEASKARKKAAEARKKGSEEIARRYEGIAETYEEVDWQDFARIAEAYPEAFTESGIDPVLKYSNIAKNEPAKPAKTEAAKAAESLTSAAKNTAAGLNAAIDGLGELFGGTGKFNSGLAFDEETYAKAKPLFKQAIAHLGDAGRDLRQAMQAIVNMVMDKFGEETTQRMKPYVVRFVKDVGDGVEQVGDAQSEPVDLDARLQALAGQVDGVQMERAVGPNGADAIRWNVLDDNGNRVGKTQLTRASLSDAELIGLMERTRAETLATAARMNQPKTPRSEVVKGTQDATGASGNLERNRNEPASEPVLEAGDGDASGAVRPGDSAGGRASRKADQGQQGDSGVSTDRAPAHGDGGFVGVHRGDGATEFAAVAAGADFAERGSDVGSQRVQADASTAEAARAIADSPAKQRDRRAEQRKAESVKSAPGIDNIRETLPALLPGQQEDVAKTEARFAKPEGYGMLLTNGTGTGKTYSGLGVAKRFDREGKKNILVVVPDEKVGSDWINSAKDLLLDASMLPDTKSAGQGMVVTTYANLGQNAALASRDWDLVIADEAHKLMQGKDGKPTAALEALRAITLHPDGSFTRYRMQNAKDLEKLEKWIKQQEANKAEGKPDEALQSKIVELHKSLEDRRKATAADVMARQGAARPRMLALSATPFAYEKSVEWAQGYLFEYPKASGSVYNSGNGQQQFMMQHFGYTMRYNKLTEPDAKVDRGLMQRNFNTWLKREGALSGRLLDVDKDYDRRFILIESKVGNRIDEAFKWLDEQARASGGQTGRVWSELRAGLNNAFDYLTRRYLLEAIKAKESIPYVKGQLALGRKVVVFHDYKKGGGTNPFAKFSQMQAPATLSAEETKAFGEAMSKFNTTFKDLVQADWGSYGSAIEAYRDAFGDGVLVVNGDEKARDNLARYKKFQDDASGPQVLLVQSAKNAGWSGHDTTGKHQRVLLNLGLPTAPIMAIQQEGRIYRTGQASNAIMRYMNTGTSWEKTAFAATIAGRASTAENLGMGEDARALKDSFIAAFEESDAYPPGHEGEGTGGKERDRVANAALSEYDRAKAYYWATQKKNSRTKAQEGVDYFATPEPLGQKMVQWTDARGGDKVLEPSAGHGAIARWFGENVERTVVEPSTELRSRLSLVIDPANDRIVAADFEDLAISNKYDAIAMNPPFGTAGRTAIDHLAKAAGHLRERGRVVAIIPTGPAADKKFDAWLYEQDDKGKSVHGNLHLVADIKLPQSAFERAGTNVAARVVVIDKISDPEATVAPTKHIDLSGAKDINEFFDRLENIELPARAVVAQEETAPAPSAGKAVEPTTSVQEGEQIIEHVTGKGKTIRGIVRKGITQAEAREIDPYTFKKGDGYFIREKYLGEQPKFSVAEDFGPVSEEFRNSPAAAIEHLKQQQEGEAVVKHPTLGDISLVWGDGKMGLSHIVARHGEKMLGKIPALLRDGEIYTKPNQPDRFFIGNDTHEAAIRMDFNGSEKAWLVSAYEKHGEPRASAQTVQRGAGKLTPEALRAEITSGVLGQVVDQMIERGEVVLHADASTLPASAKGVRGVQAVVMPDSKIHMVANAITKGNAQGVLLHEMFHRGGKSAIGGEKAWGALMGDLGSLYRQANMTGGKLNKVFQDAAARVNSARARGGVSTAMTVEEFGAYAIEEYSRAPGSLPAALRKWVEDFIGFVKAYVRKRWGKQLGQLTPAQVAAVAKMALLNRAADLAREGRFSAAPDQTQTEAFKRWFGDSKVVDAEGKPLVVYHGTMAGDITEFRPAGGREGEWQKALDHFKKAQANNERYGYMNFRSGTFFSPKPEYAGNYTRENQGLMYPVYIKAENPIYWDQVTRKAHGIDPDKTPDALIIHTNGDINEIAVIDPLQVKSAIGNSGQFDPANPDIRYSLSEEESAKVMREATAELEAPRNERIGTIDADISLGARKLVYPRTVASLHKEFTPVYETGVSQQEARDAHIADLGAGMNSYNALKPEQKLNVNKVLELGRLTANTYTAEQLRKGVVNDGFKKVVRATKSGKPQVVKEPIHSELTGAGEVVQLSAAEIKAYEDLRAMFDKALDKFRDQTLIEFGHADLAGQPDAAKALDEQAKAAMGADKERLQNVAGFIRDIEQAKRTGYVPFTRYGDYYVTVKEQIADLTFVKDGDDAYMVSGITPEMEADVIALGGLPEGDGYIIPAKQKQSVQRLAEKTVYSTKVETNIGDMAAIHKAKKEKESIENIPSVKAAIEKARKEWVGNNPKRRLIANPVIDVQSEQQVDMAAVDALAQMAQLDNANWDEIRAQLATALQARSFRKHFFNSDNIPGYSGDFERSMADYVIGMSGYLSRRAHVKDWEQRLNAIKDKPELRKYAERYRDYVNSPQEEFAALRQAGFGMYIAGVPATAFANMTQVPVLTVPVLTQVAPAPLVLKEIARAYKDVFAMVSRKNGLDMFDPNKAPADVREIVKNGWVDGSFVPLESFDMMMTARQRNVGRRKLVKGFNDAVKVAALFFSFAERLNRLVTFIAAARLAEKPAVRKNAEARLGKNALMKRTVLGDNWNAENFAKWAVDETQYRMGKANRPEISRGVGAPIMQFKGFMMQTLEVWYRMATQHGKQGKLAMAASLLALYTFSGLWGMPGADDLRKIIEASYRALTDKDLDLKTELRAFVARTSGSNVVAQMVTKGASYPLGVDLTRVGMGTIFPDSATSVAGIPADMLIGRPTRAMGKAGSGDYAGAVGELMPNFAKNWAIAGGWAADGVRDKSGQRILAPEHLSTSDLVMKSMGFQPSIVTDVRDYEYAQYRQERAVDGLKRKWTAEIARTNVAIERAEEAGDVKKAASLFEDLDRVYADIEAHNAKASPEEQIKIGNQAVRNRMARERGGVMQTWGKERKQAREGAETLRDLFGLSGEEE